MMDEKLSYRERIDRLLVAWQPEMVRLLRLLIAYNTENAPAQPGAPFGPGLRQALTRLLAQAEQWGFTCCDVDGYVGVVEMGAGERAVGVLSHLDVAPIGNGWTHDPLGGEIAGGRLYGRGAIDDKGPLVAALFAMRALQACGAPCHHRLQHIIGTNEESGAQCIKYYLSRHPAPYCGFSPDSRFPVIYGEKGILRLEINGQWLPAPAGAGLRLDGVQAGGGINLVPALAEAWFSGDVSPARAAATARAGESPRYAWQGRRLLAYGKNAHAARPWLGENAIDNLLRLMADLPLAAGPAADFVHALQRLFTGYHGQGLGVAGADEPSGPLTCCLNILRVDEGGGYAAADIRYPITWAGTALLGQIERAAAGQGLSVRVTEHKPPLHVSQRLPLVRTLTAAYQACSGRNDPPLVIGGGTYCRYLPNFVAFGPVFPGQEQTAHQADEYVELDSLFLAARIYAYALLDLVNDADPLAERRD